MRVYSALQKKRKRNPRKKMEKRSAERRLQRRLERIVNGQQRRKEGDPRKRSRPAATSSVSYA